MLIADKRELIVFRKKSMGLFIKRLVLPSLVVAGWTLCLSFTSGAQGTAILIPKERKSFTVEAIADVPIRRRPPNWGYVFLTGPGDTIGVIKKGEKVKVQGKKVIRTFFGEDIWVKFKQTNQGKKTEGWAYFGTKDASPYFQLATSEE